MGAITVNGQSTRELAVGWFDALDRHAPVDEVLPYLAKEGLVMKFPEGTFNGLVGFRDWYDAVCAKFFDETHTVTTAEVLRGDEQRADVRIVVNWQAKVWTPPAARSEWLGFDATQTWTLAVQDGAVRIVEYVVDDIVPMPGSASL
ncbi:nuclear transport factor 2 family protein [Streptomyces beihaiensis]|uniref:Nuclear transport factor 2 family protein n=1 Tax=Streptomyces beihaiensis TaxID=2984495 RepID=A0ABT3TT07_9ACTN|nr:nuclear transport factor 2 family protein [Streptomyces beihaiensis]MCX3060161.1 nuclear transport factor 2 family protein [Streptomyces beihaiensis]